MTATVTIALALLPLRVRSHGQPLTDLRVAMFHKTDSKAGTSRREGDRLCLTEVPITTLPPHNHAGVSTRKVTTMVRSQPQHPGKHSTALHYDSDPTADMPIDFIYIACICLFLIP